MAHTPVAPTGTTVDLNLTENTEIYACPLADTLEAGDLITNTGGAVNAMPTTQITRVPLHNGRDYVTPGAQTSAPFTFPVYLARTDTKMVELYSSYENKTYMKFNVFHRDGSGVAGFWIVTNIQPTTDPGENSFANNVTVEPFDVEIINPASS